MAKIRFDNGVVVNFNGDPTPKDVEEVAQKLGISKKKTGFIQDVKESFKSRTENLSEGYSRQIQGKQTFGESALQTAGQTAGLIGDIGFSGISRLASAITPDVIEKPIVETGKKLISKSVSTPLISSAISKYQKFEQEQPRAAANIGAIGNIASIIPIGKAGSVAGKVAGKTALKTAKVAGKIGEQAAIKGAGATKFGISQASGLGRDTIEQIIKNPQSFTKKTVDAISRESLGKQVKTGIVERINKLKEVGSAYEPLRKTNQIIEVPIETYTSPLSKYGLNLSNDGKLIATAESKPFSVGELNQIESFLNQYGGLQHTPNSALNAREALANIAKYDMAKSNNLTSLAKDMRSSFNTIIKNEKTGIQGLKLLDDIYSAETKVLKEIKSDYFKKGTNEFKDNALSKISNLTKEGRQSVLERLKQIDPNIESKVNILRAVEDIKASGGIKVGTYARSAAAIGGVATGNIGLILTAIASQPEILVPILRAWGKFRLTQKGFVSSLENKLKKGVKLATDEKSFVNQAINDYAKKIGDKTKNIKPGLTIEDVSKKLDPLNFKTAEDYVKAHSLYHGTPNELIGGKLTFGAGNQLKKGGYMGGHFLTDTPEIANNFSFGGKVYQASGEIKNKVLDVNKNKKLFQDYIGKSYTSDGEKLKFTQQDFDSMFPNGKADWATINTDLVEQLSKKLGKIGVVIPEYAGGKQGMTYQLFQDNIPVKTKSQLISEWNKAQKLK